MSSYIDVAHPDRHAPYLDIPDTVVDYLHYLDFVRQSSPRTINGYYLDLRGFFRYMMTVWDLADEQTPPDRIDLTQIDLEQIRKIKKSDIIKKIIGAARIFRLSLQSGQSAAGGPDRQSQHRHPEEITAEISDRVGMSSLVK